jgi:ATP-binding protein involved in chromosome partitioning
VFGHGGAELEAQKLDIPFLGAVPLHMDVRARSDSGQPITATLPDSHHAGIYREIAGRVWDGLRTAAGMAVAKPDLTVNSAGDVLTVAFPGGDSHPLAAEYLRVMSPSAEVQGHAPEQRVTVARKRTVKIRELRPIGNYAVRIVFDDGHATGLYAWDYLAELARDRDTRWAQYLAELAAKGLGRG